MAIGFAASIDRGRGRVLFMVGMEKVRAIAASDGNAEGEEDGCGDGEPDLEGGTSSLKPDPDLECARLLWCDWVRGGGGCPSELAHACCAFSSSSFVRGSN